MYLLVFRRTVLLRPKRAEFRPNWLLFVTVLFDAPPISFFFLFRAEEFTIGHFVSRSLFSQRLAVRIKCDFKPNQARHFRHLLKSAGTNAANRAEILRHHFRNNPVGAQVQKRFRQRRTHRLLTKPMTPERILVNHIHNSYAPSIAVGNSFTKPTLSFS